jgi:hypothetical protein
MYHRSMARPKKQQRPKGYFTDDTKLKIFNDWFHDGLEIKALAKKYKDPVFGKPLVREIEEIVYAEARKRLRKRRSEE